VLEYHEHQGVRNTIYTHCPLYAVNLKKTVSFLRRRILDDMTDLHECDGLCHHLAWVYGDKEVWEKVSTWSHAAQARDAARWFRVKWQAWTPASRCLGIVQPPSINRAVPFAGSLPRELEGFPTLEQTHLPLSPGERLLEAAVDTAATAKFRLKRFARRLIS
jgi:hypothetical protein